jgi:hypothetical protein
MIKKLQKTLVMLLILLVSGVIPTLSAIAEELIVSPEFTATVENGFVQVEQGKTIQFKLKLSATGNANAKFKVGNAYKIIDGQISAEPQRSDIEFKGSNTTVEVNATLTVNANAQPKDYEITIPVEITTTQGNILENNIPDKLKVKVISNDTSAPVVSITNPIDNAFYQSINLPGSPMFTVTDQSSYTTSISGWSTSEGRQTLTITATDINGNVGQDSVTYTVDNTNPVIKSEVLVDGGVYNSEVLKGKENAYYIIDEPYLETSSADELNLTPGTHSVKITAQDKAGNYAEKVITYTIDNEAPTISFKFTDGGFYTSDDFTRNFTPYYEVKDDNLDNSTIKASAPGLGEGPQSVTVSAADKANNQINAKASYTIDNTPPEVTIHLKDGKYYNAETLSKVGQFYTATDLNMLKVETAGFGSSDGHYKASVLATDKAGNATAETVEYYVDTTKPIITIDPNKIADNGFYKASYLENLTEFYSIEDVNKGTVEVSPFNLTEGTHTLTITATDKAGNIETKEISYTVDNTAPIITFNLTNNGSYQSAKLPKEYYNTSDNNGVVSVVKDAYDQAEGTHELTVTAMDAAGNSTKASIKYTVDDTAPQVSIDFPKNGGYYKSTDLPDEPTVTVKEANTFTQKITGYNKNDDGPHKVIVTATDPAGNVGSAETSYIVDNIKPVITTKITDGGYYNKETLEKLGTYYEVKDINLDLKSVSASPLNFEEGNYSATITATDLAGNKSEVTIEYIVDNTVPTISFKFDDGGFYTLDNFKEKAPYYGVNDENLDEESIEASGLSFTEEEHELTVSAYDLAKNFNSAKAKYTIDDTAPTITLHLEENKYYNQTEIDNVKDFYTVTDKNPYSVVPAGFGRTDGHYNASVTATDKAGNKTTKTVTYHVDTVDPVISIDNSKLKDGGFYQASYLESLVDYFNVADENIDRVDISPFEKENGKYTFTITATDKAGNSSSKSLSYTVDNTAPEIKLHLKDNCYYQTVKLPNEYYTATDNNAVAKVDADEYQTAEGTYTLEVTVWDAAGNSTTETVSYTVDNTAPVVTITNPENNAHYKTSALPENPEFTVDEKSPYTTEILGYNKNQDKTSTVTVTATDAAGNVGTANATYTVDNTPPVITSTLIEGGYYNKEAIENLGVYYAVNDLHLVLDSVTASELDTSEGEHTAIITAADKAGNEAKLEINYIVDNTKPVITFKFVNGEYYTSKKFKTFDPYFEVYDKNPNPASYESSGIGFEEKEHEMTVTAKDLAKNESSASAKYTIDDTAPEVTIKLVEGKYYNQIALDELGEYYTTFDENSGEIEASDLAIEDGTYTATVTATDKAGNVTSKSVKYHYDNTKPEIKIDETKLKDGGFYNAKYLQGITGDLYTVNESNLEAEKSSELNFEEGIHTFTVTATDKAGNADTKTITYTVDNTNPTITFNIEKDKVYSSESLLRIGQYYNLGDNRPLEELTVKADSLITGPDGTFTLNVTATDKAGNSTTESISYTVDDAKPVIEFHLIKGKHYTTKALLDALAGYDKYYTVTDKHLSNVEADELKKTEGIHTLMVTATDEAGNETVESLTYTVDNTGPVFSGLEGLKDGQRFLVGQDVNVNPLVKDNYDNSPALDGPTKLDTSKAGAHTITIKATDQAGNTSTFSYSYYVYNYSGVLQPVKADGSSTFKRNSTIPVKFQIFDGSKYVKDASATIHLVKGSDEVDGDPIEVTSTSSASEGNLFRYDTTGNQYIFNLNTKSLEDGEYRAIITIELDGETIINGSQTFKIRK